MTHWNVKIWIKTGGLFLAVGLLSWRVLVNGLAGYYSSQETPEADTGALRWRSDQSTVLYRRGVALSERDPTAAKPLLQAAAWGNPTDALTDLALADLWWRTGRETAATELVVIADTLAPLHSPALARSAAFWVRQNRLDLALERWNMLLRTQPENAVRLYPVLLQLAEEPTTRPLLQPWLANPPEWWDRFFAYATTTAIQPDTAVFLYQNRNRNGALPTVDEQRIYLEWLREENRWLEMYLAWLSGLDEQQQQSLGNLYNGSFELPISNVGFDWRITSPRGVTVEIIETYDTHGGKALRVSFSGVRVHFQHIYQYLYLEPGRYLLRGRARLDSLRAERGLRWRLRCVGGDTPLLAESEPFVGSDNWRDFEVEFAVPDQGCLAQLLRLELEGRVELEFEAQGDAWFDDLTISRRK